MRASRRPPSYRRWGSLTGLLQDLVDELTPDPGLPGTGSLEGDLAAVGRFILQVHRHPVHRPWMDAVTAAAVHDPAAREVLSCPIMARIRRSAAVVDAAADRGEIPPDTDADDVIRMLAAPFYYRTYVSGEPAHRRPAGPGRGRGGRRRARRHAAPPGDLTCAGRGAPPAG